MSYIFSALLGVGAYIKKDSKIILCLLFGFSVIMFGLCTKNPDLLNYIDQYDNGNNMFNEPLYLLLADLAHLAGLSYTVFRTLLCSAAFVLMTKTFIDYSPYPTMVLFLYFIYPFSIDAVQVRSFVAMSVVLYSVRFLINYHEHKDNKQIFYFAIGILIATGFHYSSILFAIIGLLFANVKKHWVFFYVIVPVMAVLFAVVFTKFMPIIASVIGDHKAGLWASDTRRVAKLNILRLVISRGGFFLLLIFFCCFQKGKDYHLSNFRKQLFKFESPAYRKAHEKEWITFCNRRIDFLLLMCVFYIFLYTILELLMAGDYERLSRPALILGTILATRLIYQANTQSRIVMWTLLTLFYIFYFCSIMFMMKAGSIIYFQYVFRQVMENNMLFK